MNELGPCIYCPKPANGEEHWLARGFGAIRNLQLLKDRICADCNVQLGHDVDQEVFRTGPIGVVRAILGIEGRHKQIVNPFHYKVLGASSPTTLLFPIDGGRQILGQHQRTPDGNTIVRPLRQLVFARADSTLVCVPFPPAYGAERLRALLTEREVKDAPLKEIYLDPGESHEDRGILETVRAAVSPPFAAEVYTQGSDGSRREVQLELGISRPYIRGLAKVAFHYYLAFSDIHRGGEFMFQPIRQFIRYDEGDWPRFVAMDIPNFIGQFDQGYAPELFGHYLSVQHINRQIVGKAQFFAGPHHMVPPSGVQLGISSRRVTETLHWVKYFGFKSGGYDGELIDMLAAGFVERRLSRTGIECPACNAPVGVTRGAGDLCGCPACGHRWSGGGPELTSGTE
jgi:hypothetical protein